MIDTRMLRAVRNPLLEDKETTLYRCVLLNPIYLSQLPEREQGAAQEALRQLAIDSYNRGGHIVDLLIDGVDGRYEWPPFIQDTLPQWEKTLEFLVGKHPHLETGVDPDTRNRSREWARARLLDCLSDLLGATPNQVNQLEEQ